MSERIVILAEKPSVARDIARVLGAKEKGEGCITGNGYAVTWAFGHLFTQLNPDEIDERWKAWRADTLPILPDEIPLKQLPKTRAQLSVIRKLFRDQETTRVICATDAGREGELIFRRIAQQLKLQKPVQRLWISSMTDEAIREGFSKLRPAADYDTLYESARCRAEADWLVGMNGSRAYSVHYRAHISVGRVQTPTLAILVRRRREIEAFVPEDYFEVEADFGDYKGLWMGVGGKTRIATEEAAKAVVQAVRGQQGTVALAERTRKTTPPPQLYDLTALQRDANRRAGLTAEQTLKAAQSLYEKHKALTYPRTDSRYLPHDMAAPAGAALRALRGEYAPLVALLPEQLPTPARVFNDAKVSDHHALLPTKKPPAQMTGQEATVYDLVVRRAIAVFLADYAYDSMVVHTACAGHTFISRGVTPVILGWRAAYGAEEADEQPPLPDLSVGDRRTVASVKAKKKATKPPPQHNEATLLSAMEGAGREVEDESLREAMKEGGLGTPATRAAIIERLIYVGYVSRKGKALLASDKGVALIDVVPEQLASPETTGKWERGLSQIRKGTMEPERFMGSIRKFAAFLCEQAAADTRPSPFPEEEKKPPRKAASSSRSSAASQGSRSGNTSQADRPRAANPAQKKPAALRGVSCPLCGGKIRESERAFGCENWKETGCKFAIWKDTAQRQGGPLLTRQNATALLREGKAASPDGGIFTLQNGRVWYRAGANAPQ